MTVLRRHAKGKKLGVTALNVRTRQEWRAKSQRVCPTERGTILDPKSCTRLRLTHRLSLIVRAERAHKLGAQFLENL